MWGAREALRQSRSTQLLARSPPSASGESGDWYDARLFGAVHAASASVQSPVLRERPALVQVSGSGGWCVCVCDHSLLLASSRPVCVDSTCRRPSPSLEPPTKWTYTAAALWIPLLWSLWAETYLATMPDYDFEDIWYDLFTCHVCECLRESVCVRMHESLSYCHCISLSQPL